MNIPVDLALLQLSLVLLVVLVVVLVLVVVREDPKLSYLLLSISSGS